MKSMENRQLSPLDRFLSGIGSALRAATSAPTRASRPNPASEVAESTLSADEQSHSAGLMRVNHAGEIAAQGLYQGHAAVARDPGIERQIDRKSVV
jgi:ubiquinone biosynthesis monooxygenase Coq7